MFTCIICHFDDIPADDVEAITPTDGRCICLSCWSREVGTTVPVMTKALIRQVSLAMEESK